jgi:hypothetical protein
MDEAEATEILSGLVEDALAHFGHGYCPYCQAYIGLDSYITHEDIVEWLEDTNAIVDFIEGGKQ